LTESKKETAQLLLASMEHKTSAAENSIYIIYVYTYCSSERGYKEFYVHNICIPGCAARGYSASMGASTKSLVHSIHEGTR